MKLSLPFTVTVNLGVMDFMGEPTKVPAAKLSRAVASAIEKELSTNLVFANEIQRQLEAEGAPASIDLLGAKAVPTKKKNLTP